VNVFFFQQHSLNLRVFKKLLHGFMNCFLFKLVGEKKKGEFAGISARYTDIYLFESMIMWGFLEAK